MKKIVNIVAVVVLVVMTYLANFTETHYTRKDCNVVEVRNNLVTIEDCSGNLWEYESAGYQKYDKVNLKMYTNKTDFIEDDMILKIETIK